MLSRKRKDDKPSCMRCGSTKAKLLNSYIVRDTLVSILRCLGCGRKYASCKPKGSARDVLAVGG